MPVVPSPKSQVVATTPGAAELKFTVNGAHPARGVAEKDALILFTVTADVTTLESVHPFGEVVIRLTLKVPGLL